MAQSSESSSLLDITSITNIANARVAIICTEWNEKIVQEQLAGARRIATATHSVITHEVIVPGSFELPFACRQLLEKTRDTIDAPMAVIVFGAVIRGGTPHFEYVCKAVTEGIMQMNMTAAVPVIFGVLTLDTEQQAWERLGGPHGHKGEEAMITALKMIRMMNALG